MWSQLRDGHIVNRILNDFADLPDEINLMLHQFCFTQRRKVFKDAKVDCRFSIYRF